MPSGGARPNSGRPKGSKNLLNLELKKIVMAQLGDAKILALVEKAFQMAMSGDGYMLSYILNQTFGKPTEHVILDADIKFERKSAKDSLQQKLKRLSATNAVVTTLKSQSETKPD